MNLSICDLGDDSLSILMQTLGYRNDTTLQKLAIDFNSITSAGVDVLLETMEHNCHISGSRPPVPPYWERGSQSSNQFFRKQHVA
jgi:hypothetical protein